MKKAILRDGYGLHLCQIKEDGSAWGFGGIYRGLKIPPGTGELKMIPKGVEPPSQTGLYTTPSGLGGVFTVAIEKIEEGVAHVKIVGTDDFNGKRLQIPAAELDHYVTFVSLTQVIEAASVEMQERYITTRAFVEVAHAINDEVFNGIGSGKRIDLARMIANRLARLGREWTNKLEGVVSQIPTSSGKWLPVGKCQQEVIERLGLSCAALLNHHHAEKFFEAVGIVVSHRREGREYIPYVFPRPQRQAVNNFGEGEDVFPNPYTEQVMAAIPSEWKIAPKKRK